jgi:aminopeptidase N
MLRAMAPHVEAQLTAAERLSLLGDEWAMVRAGRHSVEDYLALASGYTGEHASGMLKELTARLRFIHEYLTGNDIRSRVEALTRSLLRPVVDELGFAVGALEPDDRRALRATAVEALGTIADDAAVVARVRAMVDRLLAGGTSIDPTLAGAIVRVAAAHGDAALFDRLAAAGDRASSPEDRYRFLYALGDFRDPALVDRGLRRAISSGMRSQDAAQYLAQFFRNPAARGRAWSFVTKHWTALEPKLTIFGADTELVSSLSAFCDARSRDAIQTFFARHPLPGAVRTLQQTLERIDNCIAMRDRR